MNDFAAPFAGLLHVKGGTHALLTLSQALTLAVAVLGHDLGGHRIPENNLIHNWVAQFRLSCLSMGKVTGISPNST